MNLKVDYPSDRMEIQIDSSAPFVPDKVIEVGILYGMREGTLAIDAIRWVSIETGAAVVHYKLNGQEVKNYYRRGRWELGNDDLPRFHAFEALTLPV